MSLPSPHRPCERLLVVMPSWVGDAVMAMPTLRALDRLYPQARITALVKPLVRPMLESCPWVDRLLTLRNPRPGFRGDKRRKSLFYWAKRLSAGRFDAAVLLPNSFRSAVLIRMAGIPRRVGYGRDGRSTLLTDVLLPLKQGGRYIPVPTLDYYLALAGYLGAIDPDPRMELFTTPQDDRRVDGMLQAAGYAVDDSRPLILLNPGANYGQAKMWPPERFAAVADACHQRLGAVVAVNASPRERATVQMLLQATRAPMIELPSLGMNLRLLKSLAKRASVMVTNDTGPRHIAAAMGLPVVTVFGPTDPNWTTIPFELERQVSMPVFCGPCQKKTCPLDHRCMTLVTPEMVFDRVADLCRQRQLAAKQEGS